MGAGKLGFAGAGLVGVVILGACGGDSSGPDTTLTDQQAQLVGQVAASQVSALAGGLGNFSFTAGEQSQGIFSASRPVGRMFALARRLAGARARAKVFFVDPPADCTPVVVGDPSDSDGDGIPNGVTYSFSAANCSYVDSQTGYNVVITGTAAIDDTDDNDTFFGYNASFGQWTYSVNDGQSTTRIRLNGTSDADVGTGNVTGSDHYSVTLDLGPGENITLAQNWDAGFTPGVGQVIDPQAASLPAGTFDVNGNFGLHGESGGQSGNWSFSLNTTAALQFDPTCGTPDDNQLVGGSLRGAISARTSVGFTVDFNSCGNDPTVALIP
jgi:hypothetical protein